MHFDPLVSYKANQGPGWITAPRLDAERSVKVWMVASPTSNTMLKRTHSFIEKVRSISLYSRQATLIMDYSPQFSNVYPTLSTCGINCQPPKYRAAKCASPFHTPSKTSPSLFNSTLLTLLETPDRTKRARSEKLARPSAPRTRSRPRPSPRATQRSSDVRAVTKEAEKCECKRRLLVVREAVVTANHLNHSIYPDFWSTKSAHVLLHSLRRSGASNTHSDPVHCYPYPLFIMYGLPKTSKTRPPAAQASASFLCTCDISLANPHPRPARPLLPL